MIIKRLSFLIGLVSGALIVFILNKPVPASNSNESKESLSTTEIVEEVKLPDGTIKVTKTKKVEEVKEIKEEIKYPEPKLLFGYTLNMQVPSPEFTHSVYVGKKVFEAYVKDLYAVVGAEASSKLTIQKASVGAIKLF